MTSCQICEREIKAGSGVVAHHGYQRPNRGSGWQTPSCIGARFLPYELSCDRIPYAIETIKQYIKTMEELIDRYMNNPPETITERLSIFSSSSKPKEYQRPEGFDPVLNRASGYPNRGYEYEHRSTVNNAEYQIKMSQRDLDRLEKRLDAWVSPKA